MSTLFLENKSPLSQRFVILEDNGTSAWLYLTPASGIGIEKDVLVYSPIEPLDQLNKEDIQAGNPPILIKSAASEAAVIPETNADDFYVVWSQDGESVAVIYKNAPIAMIISTEKYGYSKSLSKASFFGNPWDEARYQSIFGQL
ncbi:MAG: hypothetical protein AAF485_09635 [Chloroflexota bacterium]